MVERVARGRIMVPAAAAMSVMVAGAMQPTAAQAGARDTTMQIRVQVVDSCQIRLSPSGGLDQGCGGLGLIDWSALPVMPPMPVVPPMPDMPPMPVMPQPGPGQGALAGGSLPRLEPQPMPAMPTLGAAQAQPTSATQRANDLATEIAQRVRYITVAY